MKFSVIISVYNEENNIRTCIQNIKALQEDVEIIVVDGHSEDNSYDIAGSLNVKVFRSQKGRGIQFNEGAKKAAGDILVFLHADTRLPQDAFMQIRSKFNDHNVKVSTFRMLFNSDNWILKFYSFFTRFDTILTSFGDQGIVVRRDFFESIGGFPQWPLFEDVHFLRVTRKHTKIYSLPGPVVTSARRFLKKGIIKRQILNGILILKYLFGVSPEKLYRQYYNEKAF
jgi:rSAM/selenodomain-associated transferase 2